MASASGQTRTVLLNSGSGGVGEEDEETSDKIATALAEAGVDAKVELLDGPGIVERAGELADAGAGMVIVAGGDGTISAAAGALAGTKTALAILPLGTLNHFARDLDIPFELDGAAALIAAGKTRNVDIAEVNDRTFINNSAIGLYPLMVVDRETQQRRLGRSKRLAMLVASVRTLTRFKAHRLSLTIDDREAQLDSSLLFVGNNEYSLELPGAGCRESLSNGELCVLVMRKKTRRGFLAAILRALVGRPRPDDMVRLDDVERLRVDSSASTLSVSLDGEVQRLKTPLNYAIRKGALMVIVP